MQTRLIKIVNEQPLTVERDDIINEGLFGRFTYKRPKWIDDAASALATAASSVINGSRDDGTVQLEYISLSQIGDFRDMAGRPLVIGQTYARHPMSENNFIVSELLHATILNEQRSHIIRYFRSAVALKSLTIEIVSQKTGSYYGSLGWQSAAASHAVASEQRRWFSATYNDPRKEPISPSEDLFWMSHFDEIVSATRDVSGGTIETSSNLNMSFGLSAEAAKIGKIDKNWLSQQSFIVKAEYE